MNTTDDEADAIELEEEEEEEIEIEDEGDEEEVEQVEENEDEETEDEEEVEEEKAPMVDVRDSKLAEGIPASNFITFMQNVWPILKKNGWEKVRTQL